MIIIIAITVIIVIMNVAFIGFQSVLKGLRRELINARLCGCKAAYRVVFAGVVEVSIPFLSLLKRPLGGLVLRRQARNMMVSLLLFTRCSALKTRKEPPRSKAA